MGRAIAKTEEEVALQLMTQLKPDEWTPGAEEPLVLQATPVVASRIGRHIFTPLANLSSATSLRNSWDGRSYHQRFQEQSIRVHLGMPSPSPAGMGGHRQMINQFDSRDNESSLGIA
jgi:hypothetical protein